MPKRRSIGASFGISAFVMVAISMSAVGKASAAEYEVRMLNRGEAGIMVFEPAFLEVSSGDTVHFRAIDKGHNAASIDGMIPEGAVTWKGGLNKDVTVTLEAEGVYGVRCVPHYGMGMVALIVVGDPTINLETAGQIKHPGKAEQRIPNYWIKSTSARRHAA
jgi:pseudoazurin